MSQDNRNQTTPEAAETAPQSTVFRRPCFQIAVHGSGEDARLGVRVVAAPAKRRG